MEPMRTRHGYSEIGMIHQIGPISRRYVHDIGVDVGMRNHCADLTLSVCGRIPFYMCSPTALLVDFYISECDHWVMGLLGT